MTLTKSRSSGEDKNVQRIPEPLAATSVLHTPSNDSLIPCPIVNFPIRHRNGQNEMDDRS